MMRETIICDARTGAVTIEQFEDNTPEHIDYQPEIEACKARLAETDYVVIKIAEKAATRTEYKDILAERQALRQRINELEEMAVKHGE